MVLIILGFIVFIIGLIIARNATSNYKRFASPVRLIGVVIILIGILTACIIQIDAGHIGVKN